MLSCTLHTFVNLVVIPLITGKEKHGKPVGGLTTDV